MSKQTIYASELKPFVSIISAINGSSDFVVENPWFPIPGAKPCEFKSWMNAIPDSKGGLFINAPKLYHKTPTNGFSLSYVIGWTQVVQNQKLKKEYRIHAPASQNTLKRKQKLMCSTGSQELAADDNAMLLFSWQLSIVQDVLLISKSLNIDLKPFDKMDNAAFFSAFSESINSKLKSIDSETSFEIDPEFINSWMNVPILSKGKRKEDIFIYDITKRTTPAFIPLMQSFFESITSIESGVKFDSPNIEKVFDHPNCFSIPSIRLICYIPKQGDKAPKQTLDTRLLFISKVEKGDPEFNEKFPEFICVKRQVSKTKKITLTKNDLPQLWGNTVFNPKPEKHESAKWSGCIFLQPQLAYSFHEKGAPTMDWRVDTMALTRVLNVQNEEVEDAGDFMGDDEEQGMIENAMMGNDDSPTGETTGATAGNEKEADPDML